MPNRCGTRGTRDCVWALSSPVLAWERPAGAVAAMYGPGPRCQFLQPERLGLGSRRRRGSARPPCRLGRGGRPGRSPEPRWPPARSRRATSKPVGVRAASGPVRPGRMGGLGPVGHLEAGHGGGDFKAQEPQRCGDRIPQERLVAGHQRFRRPEGRPAAGSAIVSPPCPHGHPAVPAPAVAVSCLRVWCERPPTAAVGRVHTEFTHDPRGDPTPVPDAEA